MKGEQATFLNAIYFYQLSYPNMFATKISWLWIQSVFQPEPGKYRRF